MTQAIQCDACQVEIMYWTSKQHPRKSKAKDGHQLSRDGPSNRQKNDVKIAPLAVQSTLK